MTQSIALYYTDELDNWKDSIHFHIEETDDLQQLLEDLIRRDSIPNLVGQVEHFISYLQLFRQKFHELESKIQDQHAKLTTKEQPLSNELISDSIKKEQHDLRNQMLATEKDYLDVKFKCDEFLSESILTYQIRKNN